MEILDEDADALRTQFNRDAGKVRLLFILDPACALCLRGLAELDRDLLASLPPSVAVYLVHVPMIGGRDSHIPAAAGLVHNMSVRHYWNPSGAFGRTMGASLLLRRNGKPMYAWDVWLLYGPDAVWSDQQPQPRLLMHQLAGLDPAPNAAPLDSRAFAEATRFLLAQAPANRER
ncbi:MAG TPA: hypothetical protein VIT38_11330 [Allosphingosinicella sp.]